MIYFCSLFCKGCLALLLRLTLMIPQIFEHGFSGTYHTCRRCYNIQELFERPFKHIAANRLALVFTFTVLTDIVGMVLASFAS